MCCTYMNVLQCSVSRNRLWCFQALHRLFINNNSIMYETSSIFFASTCLHNRKIRLTRTYALWYSLWNSLERKFLGFNKYNIIECFCIYSFLSLCYIVKQYYDKDLTYAVPKLNDRIIIQASINIDGVPGPRATKRFMLRGRIPCNRKCTVNLLDR